MPLADHRDMLIDALLWELLGGESPPDLVNPILAKAFPRRRRAMWWAAAAAAAVAASLLTWHFWPGGYAEPNISGVCEVTGGGNTGRGALIVTRADPATVTLGGYCRVDLEPLTVLRIEGDAHAEQVFLERGSIACEVQPKAGAFAVRTEVGTVAVAGTSFTVAIVDEQDGGKPPIRRMLVRVRTGTVVAGGAWGERTLNAGEERLLPEPFVSGQVLSESPAAPLPEGIWNFRGLLVGIIVSADPRGVVLRVTGIESHPDDKSRDPGCIRGREVRVLFNVFRDRSGGPMPDESQARAARQLAGTSQVVTLRVMEEKGAGLIMTALMRGDRTGPPRPD